MFDCFVVKNCGKGKKRLLYPCFFAFVFFRTIYNVVSFLNFFAIKVEGLIFATRKTTARWSIG